MSNINVNRNTPDPSDNDVFRSSSVMPNILVALGPLIWRIGLVFAGIWLIGIAINGLWCSLEPYDCIPTFWSIIWLPAITIFFAFIGAGWTIALAIQDYKNRAFLGYNEPKIHRETLKDKEYTHRIFDVATANVRSKGTAGMDTWSPSTTYQMPKDKPITLAPVETKDPDDGLGLAVSFDDVT